MSRLVTRESDPNDSDAAMTQRWLFRRSLAVIHRRLALLLGGTRAQ